MNINSVLNKNFHELTADDCVAINKYLLDRLLIELQKKDRSGIYGITQREFAYNWNKATLTKILTRQEYCGDVVNFKTAKHFRDKRNHYVDRSQWQITENVHEPIIDRADSETVQRILENAPVKRPNGDGEIHPLSGLLFCKDCGAKMHIRID